MIKENSKIENLVFKFNDVEKINSIELANKKFLIYFYPKDDTPGCTKQAIGFSDQLKNFNDMNVTIYGVSKDSFEKHEKFKLKHNLKIKLISDDGSLCSYFGVWVEKSMYGKVYMGIDRSTFFIDNLVVKKIWRKVKVKGHVDEVIDFIKNY